MSRDNKSHKLARRAAISAKTSLRSADMAEQAPARLPKRDKKAARMATRLAIALISIASISHAYAWGHSGASGSTAHVHHARGAGSTGGVAAYHSFMTGGVK